ncbi:DUF721 domain-containing protein [Legionella jordanis]|uniref:Zn-ribbon-containing, possibly RNA-binding protein and truncated derivatives n=1 Tax=Legionella jordanis TaxID=456 RepID=A0A0W0VDM3_9GAMM|nr:DUF721 domain-containing protein [Legionella jordanis]KTD18215.1 hypothetical protein Ljor_2521 [Legionella jordanis]RMX01174.1 DUF721 domain-containing protein [Legionella jordanis]RMX21404.1 DUF721 domain-containing protein [Legionella jordanis]VEH13692.1 Zn-ribbon-containing, possible RNA-binding protein-like protein [Legionella jordanis]HAT8714597.1 DUF721 domain-containing protein [Legionella jordanis]
MRRVNACLNKQLSAICENALQLEALNVLIKGYLPQHLIAHCQVASFTKGNLTIQVTHAAWATELRYLCPELRDRLRKDAGLYQLTGIKISLSPPLAADSHNKSKSGRILSESARTSIMDASEGCQYEPLKRALKRLVIKDF